MKRVFFTAAIAAGFVAIGLAQGTGRTHELPLKPESIHWGYYDPKIAPVLKIASGDRVRVETMVAGGLARLRLAGVPESDIPDSLKAVEKAVTERGPGAHPMSGPIFIEGAEPGDSIEIHILSIEFLHNFGVGAFNPGGGTLPDDFPYAHLKLVRWQPGATTVEFAPGITLKLAPFFGSIGVAPPPLVGRISSRPPGYHGGNLDNKDLVAGSTLFLPVHVPGALLSIGDGHGLQGDGEVTGTALETSLRGTFEIRLRKGKRLLWPRAETPTDYISMGLSEDLDEATRMATREMVDFLVAEKGLTRDAAYVLCSFAANLHVTQSVDQTKGVHATLSKSIFTEAARNDLPQPYHTSRDWGELPPGVKWAAVTAVEAAPDGSLYVIHRCFANSCAGRNEAPILKYDASGKLLQSWGAGMFVFPHGATVDRDGNLWVTDAGGEEGKGHQVFKFDSHGKVLMTLGKAGVSGSDAGLFDQPTDIVVAPNGDLFVTDSHRNGKNNRVVKFSKDGKFIKQWGKKGSGRGEMSEPHTIAMDSRGRLFVGDRENNRIQIFDQDGNYIDEWRQFGRPSGIYITKDDTIYVADSESGPDTGAHELMGIKKGIRIGSAVDGQVLSFIEDAESTTGPHSGAEGVGVDAEGNVYGGVVRRQMLERHAGENSQPPKTWTEPFPPFRIADNFYYVGSKGLANYLITTPQGHILINSDLEANVPLIKASIEKLGFKFSDVKILLINQAHWDHDAGSATIKKLTGAQYMVMDADVSVVESGGKTDFHYRRDPSTFYLPVKVDRVLHDGEEIRLGGTVVTARLTPGHTQGCTTFTMKVQDGGKTLTAVIVGGTGVNPGFKLVNNPTYPRIAEDYEQTFKVLKSLPVDIFLGAHGEYFGMDAKYPKLVKGDKTALIDPAGYQKYVAEAEKAFLTELAKQKGGR